MPAVAITEHGNMFSSVVFHDQARKRGINPILGCEVYVAPGDRRTKSGTPGETANHLVLLAETNEGYHNLIKLVSSGYTEGFYYKPRIDKELLAQHAKGLIGLSSCLKGEVATGIRTEQQQKAMDAAAAYRDILGPDNFFLEMQYQGIDEQQVVNVGLQPIAKGARTCTLVVTNDVHYLQNSDSQAARHPAVHRHRQDGQRHRAAEVPRRPVLPEDRRGDGRGLRRLSRGAGQHRPDRGALQRRPLGQGEPPPELRRPGRLHARRLLRARRPPGVRACGCRGCSELAGARASLKHTIDEYERRLTYEIEMIKKMKYPGYFLITWDFIRYAREQGIPVGPGRGSAAGSFVAYCLRITDVDPIEYDLIFERFLNPERVSLPDIDIDFCERRRGEVIDYVTQQVRPRERRADHHLRDDEGARGGPRRRPGDGHSLRRRRPGRQGGPAGARHDPRQGARGEPGAQGDGSRRTSGSRSCSTSRSASRA